VLKRLGLDPEREVIEEKIKDADVDGSYIYRSRWFVYYINLYH